jgi:hypothetical protein
MHHKRTLNFTKFENNIEGNIWSLFWYGKIFFKSKDSRFYIEIYLVLLNKENYFLDSLNKNRIEKIEIPFTKSILFPLSSQFDYQGKFLRMSQLIYSNDKLIKNGLYKFGKLRISNSFNFKITDLDTILSDTSFPNVFENGNSIFKDSSYFAIPTQSTIKKLEENKNEIINQFIIPIDVVLKYFFGYSSLIYDLLITNRLQYAIFDRSIDTTTKKGKIFYRSNLIPRADASLIAKYFFTRDRFAEKLIGGISSYFDAQRTNNNLNGSFIKFKIPFDFSCEFTVVGQYLTQISNDIKTRKIIVNQILEIASNEKFFTVDDDIDLIDVDSSLNENNEENDSEVKDVRNNNDVNPIKEKETDDLPLDKNNNDIIVENNVVLRNSFLESPTINNLVLSKNKDGNAIYLKDDRPVDHSDFPYYEGTKRRKIINLKNINWLEIIEETVEYLVNNKEYQSERLLEILNERLLKKVIFKLTFKNVNYYIVDSGGNNYFPLFRNKNKNESIDLDVINDIMEVIGKDYKSSWSVVSNKKSLKSIDKFSKMNFLIENDILFLRNNTHELIGKEDEDVRTKTIENLANKIHQKILKDIE